MFLTSMGTQTAQASFLHARGDVSSVAEEERTRTKFSPRTWRCFPRYRSASPCFHVFSTHVEMFLKSERDCVNHLSFLHARGDVSAFYKLVTPAFPFSPRTWRCFLSEDGNGNGYSVFSTHVEMFPHLPGRGYRLYRFLHARGEFVYV